MRGVRQAGRVGAVHARSGNRRQPGLEAIAQQAQPGVARRKIARGEGAGLAEADHRRDIDRRSPALALLGAADEKRRKGGAAADPERRRAERTVELVRRERQVVHSKLLDRDRDLSNRLDRIAEHRHAALAQGRRQFGHRLEGPELVVGQHEGSEPRPGTGGGDHPARGHHPVLLRRHLVHDDPGAGGAGTRGAEDRRVLEGRNDEPVARSALAQAGSRPRHCWLPSPTKRRRSPPASGSRSASPPARGRLRRPRAPPVRSDVPRRDSPTVHRSRPPRRARGASPPGPRGREGSSHCGRSTIRASGADSIAARPAPDLQQSTGMPTPPRRIGPTRGRLPVGLCLLLALLGQLALQPCAARGRAGALSQEYLAWLEEVDSILTPEERAAFLALDKDYQRDAFIERFWQARDPYPDTVRNEMRETWTARVEQARLWFGSLKEERARLFLLNGAPAARLEGQCAGTTWPLEIWVYPRSERIREDVVMFVFYRRFAQGPFRLWYPDEGLAMLMQFAPVGTSDSALLEEMSRSCMQRDDIAAALANILRRGRIDFQRVLETALAPIAPISREWVATFNSYSTDLPEGVANLSAELAIAFPGRRQSRSVMQGTLAVSTAGLTPADNAGARSFDFQLNGEILIGKKLFDAFRYKFDIPLATADPAPRRRGNSEVRRPPPGRPSAPAIPATIPLVFERFLRPGKYTLILKLEDLNGGGFFRKLIEVEVPAVEGPVPQEVDAFSAGIFAEANAALSTLDNTIRHRAAARRAPGRAGALRQPHHRNRHLRGAVHPRRPVDPAQEPAALFGGARPRRGAAHPDVARQRLRRPGEGGRLGRDPGQCQQPPFPRAAHRAAPRRAVREEPARRSRGRSPRGRRARSRRVLPQRDPGGDALPGAVHPADRAPRGWRHRLRPRRRPSGRRQPDRGSRLRQRAGQPRGARRPVRRALHHGARPREPPGPGSRTGRLPRPRGRRAAGDRALRAPRKSAHSRRHPARRLGFHGEPTWRRPRRRRSSSSRAPSRRRTAAP